jgi:hypothetical protein
MLQTFSFQGLSKETYKEKRKTIDVSQLQPMDPKKSVGLSEEVVKYMISIGILSLIKVSLLIKLCLLIRFINFTL